MTTAFQLPGILAGSKRMPDWLAGLPQPNDGERHPMDERTDLSGMPAYLSASTGPAPIAPADLDEPQSGLPEVVSSAPVGNSGPPSLSQTFDTKAEYDRVVAALQPAKRKINLWDVLGVVGPALQAFGGDTSGSNRSMGQFAERRREEQQTLRNLAMQALKWKQDEFARNQDLRADVSKPFTIGRDRVMVDPSTGKPNTLFHGPADYEDYAGKMGYQPGTDQYRRAAEDYVLRGNGPSAMGYDKELDDHRTGNRVKLDGTRQAGRVALERLQQGGRVQLRTTPTYRDTHPLPGRSGGGGLVTATNPATGEKMRLVNGQWVPAK